MNIEGLSSDTSSTRTADESDGDNTTPETGSAFARDAKSVTKRIRSLGSDYLRQGGNAGSLLNIVIKAIKESEGGAVRTEPTTGNSGTNGLTKTASESLPKSASVAIVETPQRELEAQSLRSERGESLSMSSVDSAISLLHSAMKKMLEPDPINPERRTPVECFHVNAATKCAAEIAKLMKIKIEAHRMLRE